MADDEKPRKPPLPPGFGGKPPLPSGAGGPPPPPPLPGRAMPPALPSNLPPLPGLFSAPKPPIAPGLPLNRTGLPGMPSYPPSMPPGIPGAAGYAPLPPMSALGVAAAPQSAPAPQPPDDDKIKLEKKLSELEKKLSEEREKLLVASIKREEENATAARVEVSIKELQDKLRRDRREQEGEESRLKLEQKLGEMEQRLAQERETWLVTLRNQLHSRESQDKEVETHFGMRVQEMERRWLEEKAQWQKVALSKDEEIRNLRSLAEKLKGADVELSKTVSERKWLEARVNDLTQERAEAVAKLQSAAEREKDNIQLRADLQLSRQQLSMVQDKLERDLQLLRMSAKEREERLLSDQERLQRDLASLAERLRAEHEAALRQAKADHESEQRRIRAEGEAGSLKYKESLERATTDLQKLRGVAGALERQLGASRAQINDLQTSRLSWEKTQERYKAEFVVLQRKWVEREKEIRAESDARAHQMLEAEKAKLKIIAQDEINQRVARAVEQLAKDRDAELKRAEASMRLDLERASAERLITHRADWDKARKEYETELERLHQELRRKETEWTERMLSKESSAQKAVVGSDEALAKLRAETVARQQLERQKLELEKEIQAAREQGSKTQGELEEARRRIDALESLRSGLTQRHEELERLCTAQGAHVQNLQQLLEQARGELAREVHLARLYLRQKEEAQAQVRGPGAPPEPPGAPKGDA